MRRLVVSLLVLAALLVVLDRVSLWAAQHDVAKRLQADSHLRTTPKVEIHGFPFLTQLVAGDYHDVDVVMDGLDVGSFRVDLRVHVQGAHVSIGDVISQDRSRIRIDHARATLSLSYDALPTRLSADMITGATVRGADTVVLQTRFGDVPLRLPGLPFGIRLTSAKATQVGIEVSGAASGLVLRT
jgi:hypothetical protein